MNLLDINLLRSLVTLLSFIAFVCIIVWAWRLRDSKQFNEAAHLPFDEE